MRKLLEDKAQWGHFMPLAGCMPQPGNYVCGPNATQNLFHDFEQTPRGDCGSGVECGEYVFDHRNSSVREFFLGDYFFPKPFPKSVTGYYVDDGVRNAHRATPRATATLTPTRPRAPRP